MVERVERLMGQGVTVEADVSGEGPPVVLVHGFPHTRRVWSRVAGALSAGRQVIAPDLRGIGGSSRAVNGYDAETLAGDLVCVLDGLDIPNADVVALDAGVPAAFLLALRHPHRVRRLVLMESTLGTLPGAEEFFRAGPPWWFGFHQVPGLAERVIEGHEGDYLDFFYRMGTWSGYGIDSDTRDAFVRSYSGTESLRCGFEYYRAMPETARQLADAVATRTLSVPTMAIGSHPVGDALAKQLAPNTCDLTAVHIDDCGHIIPLDRPDVLLELLAEFLPSTT